jgi:hypothetical protein
MMFILMCLADRWTGPVVFILLSAGLDLWCSSCCPLDWTSGVHLAGRWTEPMMFRNPMLPVLAVGVAGGRAAEPEHAHFMELLDFASVKRL